MKFGQIVANRAKLDPLFKREVLRELRRQMKKAKTETCKAKLQKAIAALEKLK